MKANGGVEVYIHIFLTSALVGGEWSTSRPGRFNPRERPPGTHWIGGWVDLRDYWRVASVIFGLYVWFAYVGNECENYVI
jgi:hypothetical protein